MKKIPLTKGKCALVDDHDYEYLNQWKWYCGFYKKTRKYYARHRFWNNPPEGYKSREDVYMHKLILSKKGYVTDHTDGNGLNNQRTNLRIATKSQDCANKSMYKNNTSGYKGVSWHTNSQKWRTAITVNGVLKYLGLFKTKERAAKAYNQAAIKYFGKFAR